MEPEYPEKIVEVCSKCGFKTTHKLFVGNPAVGSTTRYICQGCYLVHKFIHSEDESDR